MRKQCRRPTIEDLRSRYLILCSLTNGRLGGAWRLRGLRDPITARPALGPGSLAGRKGLITGTDSGTGRAAVIAGPHQGADVSINWSCAEEPDARDDVVLIVVPGARRSPTQGDLRDEACCHRLVKGSDERPRRSRIVVCKAGR